jgi:hypothetical protein
MRIDCEFFKMAPNPADDYVEISLDDSKVDIANLVQYEIRIINSQNTIVSQTITAESSIIFNTEQYVSRTYFV